MDAREEAAVEEVPGEECSAKMVVLCAMQALPDGQLEFHRIAQGREC